MYSSVARVGLEDDAGGYLEADCGGGGEDTV